MLGERGGYVFVYTISSFKFVLHAALGAIGTILTNKDHHLAYTFYKSTEASKTQSIYGL